MKIDNTFKILITIFLIGFMLRVFSVYPANIVIGFDQVRDLFQSIIIFKDQDLKIIGPTAGNNPNLHHGIAFIYFLLPPLILFGPNPLWVVVWNSLFNAATTIVLYWINFLLFKKTLPSFLAAFIAATSFHFINFSGWLSNPTVAIFTVPSFFLGLLLYFRGKKWGLPLAGFFLGLSIQFELFFIYLIPIAVLVWLILRPKFPDFKLLFLTFVALLLSLSTMIATEIKFKFLGVLAILKAGELVGGETDKFKQINEFFNGFIEAFALNLWPQRLDSGKILALVIIAFLVWKLIKNQDLRKSILFLLIYLFSPALMLLLGYHNAPWFLVGLPPAIALVSGFVISELKNRLIMAFIVIFMISSNFLAIQNILGKGQLLLGPDSSSILSTQLAVIDYTYQRSEGNNFSINTLTNPLYINALWAYHYQWYGKGKYGYIPGWSGGDQLYPYDTLPKSELCEKYLYLISDTTFRIPYVHQLELIKWAEEHSKLLEEKKFKGINVQKRELFTSKKC